MHFVVFLVSSEDLWSCTFMIITLVLIVGTLHFALSGSLVALSFLVVTEHLCRFYQMMRKDLYMIALVRQVCKENMMAQLVVLKG